VAVAIRKLQADGTIKRAMVVDTDVHHGNGTAAIFRNDPTVFTISIHQENNYPAYKPPSSIDLNMADRVEDDEYLEALIPAVKKAVDDFSRRFFSMWEARIPTARINSADYRSRRKG